MSPKALWGFLSGSVGKESACNAGNLGLISEQSSRSHQPFTAGALATPGSQGSQFFITVTRHRDRKFQLSLALLELRLFSFREKHKLYLLNLDWCIRSNKNDTFLETFGNTINNGFWILVSY